MMVPTSNASPTSTKPGGRQVDESLVRRVGEVGSDRCHQGRDRGTSRSLARILACRSAAAHRQVSPSIASIGQAGRVDVVWMVLAIGFCVGLLYLGYRIEPHHVSKDGKRFLCTGQWLSAHGDADGRKREVWVTCSPDGQLHVDVKRRLRHDVTHWSLEGKAPNPPPCQRSTCCAPVNVLGGRRPMTIKVPSKSRAVAILDEAMITPAERDGGDRSSIRLSGPCDTPLQEWGDEGLRGPSLVGRVASVDADCADWAVLQAAVGEVAG